MGITGRETLSSNTKSLMSAGNGSIIRVMGGKRISQSALDEIACLYAAGETAERIELLLGIGHSSVSRHLARIGVKTNRKQRHRLIGPYREGGHANRVYQFDREAFRDLTPLCLYWLGFLFADGCTLKKCSLLSLVLSEKDADHVERFRSFIKTEASTYHVDRLRLSGIGARALRINSVDLCQRLTEIGMTQPGILRKAPDSVVQSADFWRGVCDGDGCLGIYHYEGKDRAIRYILMLCGGKPLVDQFILFAQSQNVGFAPSHYGSRKTKAGHDYARVFFTQRQARRLAECLYYPGNPCSLPRKQEIANVMIALGSSGADSHRLRSAAGLKGRLLQLERKRA